MKKHPLNPLPENLECYNLEIVIAVTDSASIENTLLFMDMIQSEFPQTFILLRDITNRGLGQEYIPGSESESRSESRSESLNSPIIFVLNPLDKIARLDCDDLENPDFDLDNIYYQQSFQYLSLPIQEKFFRAWKPFHPTIYFERFLYSNVSEQQNSLRQRLYSKMKMNSIVSNQDLLEEFSLIQWAQLLDFYLMGNHKQVLKYFRMNEIKDDEPISLYFKNKLSTESRNSASSPTTESRNHQKLKSLWSFV